MHVPGEVFSKLMEIGLNRLCGLTEKYVHFVGVKKRSRSTKENSNVTMLDGNIIWCRYNLEDWGAPLQMDVLAL